MTLKENLLNTTTTTYENKHPPTKLANHNPIFYNIYFWWKKALKTEIILGQAFRKICHYIARIRNTNYLFYSSI